MVGPVGVKTGRPLVHVVLQEKCITIAVAGVLIHFIAQSSRMLMFVAKGLRMKYVSIFMKDTVIKVQVYSSSCLLSKPTYQ